MAHERKHVVYLLASFIFFVSIDVSIEANTKWVVDDEGCRTPDGGVGDCIPIRECKTIIDFLSNAPKPLSHKIKRKLNSYTCSYEASTVKVCCPSTPIAFNEGSNHNTDSTEFPPSPDVSNHKNYYLLPKDCGYLSVDDKIINGQNAALNEFPWMALLSYQSRNGAEFKCGGSIINEKWILTAAHCVANLRVPLLGVRVGEYNIRTQVDCEVQPDGSRKCAEPVQDLAIEEIIPHPSFNLTVIDNDIALVKVTKMDLNRENVRPVCLPTDNARDATFANAIVTGWGVTASGQSSDILQKVALPVMTLEQCKSVYKKESKVQLTYKQLCAGGKNNKDSCPGDSGGPLHVASYLNDETRYVQQGIVSFGPRECGLQGYPGVYTKISYYMHWILDTITP